MRKVRFRRFMEYVHVCKAGSKQPAKSLNRLSKDSKQQKRVAQQECIMLKHIVDSLNSHHKCILKKQANIAIILKSESSYQQIIMLFVLI